jgi:CheY-like chemotaxis protein
MSQKVLVVDDVNMFLDLMKDYLKLSSVKVFQAKNGEEALKICREERPHLVFMDLHMPVMNGADCCRAIKAEKELAATPVVLITSEGKDLDRWECRKAGCDGFITKPLDRHVFLEMARSLLPTIERRDLRIPCRFNIKYRAFGITRSGFVADLSQYGMYLCNDHPVEQDAVIDLVFALPEPIGSVIQTQGRVAWINNHGQRQKASMPVGFGVEFVSLSEEAAAAIARYIDHETKSTSPVWRAS